MTAFPLEKLVLLLMTQKFSSFGNNDIATLHEDELAKEDIDWDPCVHFTSHTDKGEAIPIKIRRSMGKVMTNRTMYILGCLLKLRSVNVITSLLLSICHGSMFSRVTAVLLKPLHSDSVSSHPSYWFLYVFSSLPAAASSDKKPSENKGMDKTLWSTVVEGLIAPRNVLEYRGLYMTNTVEV